ncbi:MAG: hypothetical protein WC748_09835 [Legionellales bacterium]|jgi:hypothetical protein
MDTNEKYILLKVAAEYIEKLTTEKALIQKKIDAFTKVLDVIAAELQKGGENE